MELIGLEYLNYTNEDYYCEYGDETCEYQKSGNNGMPVGAIVGITIISILAVVAFILIWKGGWIGKKEKK